MVKSTYKQTVIGIWLHGNNLRLELQNTMKRHLNQTFHYYRIFINPKDFYKYIGGEQRIAKMFLIISISGAPLDSLAELIKKHPTLFEKVYRFSSTENHTSDCCITNSMNDLFKEINQDIQNYTGESNSSNRTENETCTESRPLNIPPIERPLPSLSIFNAELKTKKPIRHVTKESLNFLCFLAMTDILRRISSYSGEDLLEMWTRFRDLYKGDQMQLDHIDKLEQNYNQSEAIRHYTGNSCLSRTVNQACHTEDMQEIFTFRVYIRDLHKQIVQCHEQDKRNELTSLIRLVYRGKPLSESILQKLVDNVGGLISMNGFLSTTIVNEVASHYHGDEQVRKVRAGYKPVLFVFKINATVKQPYAYIGSCSTKPYETEVLFSIGTIWHIESVKTDNDPCIVELRPDDEFDLDSTEMLKKYTKERYDLSSIGDILLELGDDYQAEWFYQKMLNQTPLDDEMKGSLNYKIGMIRYGRKDYSVALERLQVAAKLLPLSTNKLGEVTAPPLHSVCGDQSPCITMYINMGVMYEKDGQFRQAVNCYKQAVKIKNELKSGIAVAHDLLGLLYYRLREYEEARKHHMEAVELIDERDSHWKQFQANLDEANKRCKHLANEQ